MSKIAENEYWNDIARHWNLLGAPLRPTGPDLAGYWRGIQEFEKPRAAILGVTPELYGLPWPHGTSLIAIDHNSPMIEAVWPGPRESAVCGDWKALPLADSSRNLVLCDGGISVLGYPHEAGSMIAGLWRALVPQGLAMIRLYVDGGTRETPETVFEDLLAGSIPSLNHLKLRLGMAMQANSSEGVELATIWSALNQVAPDFEWLAGQIGWNLDQLLAINSYRGSRNRYFFPTVDEIEALFAETGFVREWLSVPDYAMGERCPVACFRRV